MLVLTIWLVTSVHVPVPNEVVMETSWYGEQFQGLKMANGQRFDRNKLTVAHRYLPLGTEVLLTNPCNGKKIRAIVKDRGPYIEGRDLDVSEKVAKTLELRMNKRGTAPVRVQPLNELGN